MNWMAGEWYGEVRTVVSARRDIDGPRDAVRRALWGRAAVTAALLSTQSIMMAHTRNLVQMRCLALMSIHGLQCTCLLRMVAQNAVGMCPHMQPDQRCQQ